MPCDSRRDAGATKTICFGPTRLSVTLAACGLSGLGDLELYLITLLQALVAFRSNRAVVHNTSRHRPVQMKP